MTRDHSDTQRKKLVSELLRNADKLLKSGDYEQALSEVEKSLELEPGNFYAQAYKERIATLREKYRDDEPAEEPAREPLPPDGSIPQADIVQDTPDADVPAETGPPAMKTDVDYLREQFDRDRAAQESEAERQTAEFAKKALEEEIQQVAAAGKLIAAEREATARAVEEGRARARSEFIARSVEAVGKLLESGDAEAAYSELVRLKIVDPENKNIEDFGRRIDASTEKMIIPAAAEPLPIPRETITAVLGTILKAAWREGTPNETQAGAIANVRSRLGVTPAEEKAVMSKVQREVIAEAMREAFRDGEPDPVTKSFLDRLTTELTEGIRSLR